ncbi:MAG: sodium:proton antiporter [Ignavibacteria bacterium]|nr:sodium:proton antiporter [Ignavibacteria bacterium]MBI3766651.1 sodium:proton antiporter [Ignavibacteriales bacterium]
MIIPFILLLLSIAVIPFLSKRWWEKYYPAVSVVLGAITVVYYLFFLDNTERMVHTGIEYLSFIILIGSLFVVAGGIHIRLKGKSTPIANVIVLAIGAVASNFLGTTGASMIMIRPYLRVNKYRLRGFHVVFFIFIVSNIGGALTPIGDPPLFLGYLKGVPFFWVLEYVWHIWSIAVASVLVIFFVIDYLSFKKFEASKKHVPETELHEKAEVSGLHNIFFLAVILLAVFIEHPVMLRELLMVIAATGSYVTTKKEIHNKNNFNFVPIKEVAILFLGIFATMVPALDWLELNATTIGITSAGQFYWGTGILSSVLDNAPTYLNFLSASIGLFVDQNIVSQVQHLISTHGSDIANIGGAHAEEVRNTFATLMKYHSDLVATGQVPVDDIQISYLIGNHNIYLKAISIAAVFFGANTYIGNGPNFMVKSIAEQSGAECPSFGGYIAKYSLPILIPVFAVVWWIFFTG